jgi:polar amino acid transport system substrate-binding protein
MVFTIVLLSILVNSASAGEIFFIADSMEGAPFKSVNSKGKPDGIFYAIVSSAFRHMKVPLKYEAYPWKRAQMLVKTKHADALITVPTPDRLEYLAANREPVFIAKTKIFTQRDNPNIKKIKSANSLDDLKGLKIIDFIGEWIK